MQLLLMVRCWVGTKPKPPPTLKGIGSFSAAQARSERRSHGSRNADGSVRSRRLSRVANSANESSDEEVDENATDEEDDSEEQV